MKYLTSLLTVAALGFAISTTAQASAVFKSPIGWAGTGCKANSGSFTGANTTTLSILFDAYDAGKDSLSGLKRSACAFAIPIKVPHGFRISHLTADWEGYIDGKGQLRRKYFLAGNPYTAWLTNDYNKPGGDNFSKRDNLYHTSFSSHCNGGQYNLRINSQIKVTDSNSYAAVDSVDLKRRILFRLKFKKC